LMLGETPLEVQHHVARGGVVESFPADFPDAAG
jgi:hypothetical protein